MGRLLFLALAIVNLFAQSRDERIGQQVESIRSFLVECRRDIHMHPELSNQEVRTGKLIAERLRVLGYTEIRTGVAGHGVVAVLRGGKAGPVVAWRADMDALPIDESGFNVPYKSTVKGVKHACGHDAHTTIGLGLAEVLMKFRAEVAGTIVFVFQPAEEGGLKVPSRGAKLMLEEGVFRDPTPAAIFALHVNPQLPVGKVSWIEGPHSASVAYLTIKIIGKRAHGAYPYQGIDAVAVAAQCVSALQSIHARQIDTKLPSVFSLGTIRGGDRRNVIAQDVTMDGTVRTYHPSLPEEYENRIKKTLAGCTSAMGASFELDFRRESPVAINDPVLTRKTVVTLQRILKQENVVEAEAGMSGEDFAYFQRIMPGVMFGLGVSNEAKGIKAALHTAEFDLDEDALTVGVKAGAGVLLDYLEGVKK